MRSLIWRPEARAQLAATFTFISARNVGAADRLQRLIEERVESLRRLPHIGRSGRVAGTRELIVHPNYIVIYQVTATAVDVLRVLHVRQRYP